MLKLIAPFRAMFNLNSSVAAANPSGYSKFLQEVAQDIENKEGFIRGKLAFQPEIAINYPKKTGNESELRFINSKRSGSFYTSPHILSLSFNTTAQGSVKAVYDDAAQKADNSIAPYSRQFEANLTTLRVDICDNTIALLSLDFSVKREHLDTNPGAWDALDEWTTALVHYLLLGLYQSYIYPVLAAVTEFSAAQNANMVRLPQKYKIFSDITQDIDPQDYSRRFMLMWVNRTLCYFQDYPANNWIRALVRTEISRSEAEVHINQGNCIITLPQQYNRSKMESFWSVAYPAQYYYAAMDVVNINLMKYIGIVFDTKNSRKLRELQADMEDIINKVTMLQSRFHDMALEMQGVAGKIFEVLQQEWYFSRIVENVRKKLELCRLNIQAVHELRVERMLNSLVGIVLLVLLVQFASLLLR